ncbi:hypothetical protein [Streptomyces sp. NPDC024089]|uniref:hypothetical protein n=1 Tax=Streptomyces sp. NPDC024089 TaxID=3154328 RepID=UPI0033E5A39A
MVGIVRTAATTTAAISGLCARELMELRIGCRRTPEEPVPGLVRRRVSSPAAQSENRIRAAMDRFLRGEIPPGGVCGIRTLASEAAVVHTAFHGARPYAHPCVEVERRLNVMREVGEFPDSREAQISGLREENTKLRERLAQSEQTVDELTDFRSQALARLAAQHEEIVRLREAAAGKAKVSCLTAPRTAVIGSCN